MMTKVGKFNAAVTQAVFAGVLVAGVSVFPDPAWPGECPADQVLQEPRELEKAPDIGVQRPVLATVDLTGWREMGNFMLRLRRLTIAPGGVVPTHWHDDRPSIVYIVKGELIEHNHKCAVPILHREGEWTPESGPNAHWWENKSGVEAVVLSTDVVPFKPQKQDQMGDM